MGSPSSKVSPPFENYTFRTLEEVWAENDSDASYDTDEERKKFEYEMLKYEFPECWMPVPRGIQESCHVCKGSVVVSTDKDVKKLIQCENKDGGEYHYRRWWDEASTEELEDRKEEILKLKEKVSQLEDLISKLTT